VVIGQAAWIDTESRESNERQICRIQHQLQRHEDDDEIASQHDSGKPNGKKNPADEKVIAECDHAIEARACSKAPRQWSPPARGPRQSEAKDCNCGKARCWCSAHGPSWGPRGGEKFVGQLENPKSKRKSGRERRPPLQCRRPQRAN